MKEIDQSVTEEVEDAVKFADESPKPVRLCPAGSLRRSQNCRPQHTCKFRVNMQRNDTLHMWCCGVL